MKKISLSILPDWCRCEVKETDENEINDFKDKMITAIKDGKKGFDDYKNSVIQKIIHQANSQGVSETELNNNRPNWQNRLRAFKSRKV
ncbi:31318_t:CDS:2, partial [Racocetra persica]